MKNSILMPKAFLFDLDGVLFMGNHVIPGAIETISFLKDKNIPCRFLTNTTTRSFESLYQKFHDLKLPIKKEELFAPPKIAAQYLTKIGNPTVSLILEDDTKTEFSKFQVNDQNPDFIILGHYGENWNYQLMQKLFTMVMNGSKILALHKGRYWQTEKGLTLDIGAFVAGIEHATSEKAIVVGKPSETFFQIALDDIGVSASEAIMVGDDIINDIQGAQNVGIKTILVKTGKYREEIVNSSGVQPDFLLNSVADIKQFLS